MARPVRSLEGRRFGLLKVSYLWAVRGGHAMWACDCECGAVAVVEGHKLVCGRVKSCGCYRADPAVRRGAALKQPRKKRQENARNAIAKRWAKVAKVPEAGIPKGEK